MPKAPPETTVQPSAAHSAAIWAATSAPYVVAERDPTTATDRAERVEPQRTARPEPERCPAGPVRGPRRRRGRPPGRATRSSPGTTNRSPSRSPRARSRSASPSASRAAIVGGGAGAAPARCAGGRTSSAAPDLGDRLGQPQVAGLAGPGEGEPGQPLPGQVASPALIRPASSPSPSPGGRRTAAGVPRRPRPARAVDPGEVGQRPGDPVDAHRTPLGDPAGEHLLVEHRPRGLGQRPAVPQRRAGRLAVEPPALAGVPLLLPQPRRLDARPAPSAVDSGPAQVVGLRRRQRRRGAG